MFLVLACGGAAAATGEPLVYEQGIERVRQLSAAGRYSEAEMLLERLSQRYPGNPELEAFSGRLAAWQKRFDLAIQAFQRSLRLRPSEEVAGELARVTDLQELQRATEQVEAGNLQHATVLLGELCHQGRERYESCRRLGAAQLRLGQISQARQTFQELCSHYPDDMDMLLLFARSLAEEQGATAALNQLSEWRGEVTADLLHLKGQLYGRLLRWDEAVTFLQLAAAKRPSATLQEELAQAKIRLALLDAARRKKSGDLEGAESAWRALYESGQETYESGLAVGRLMLERRQYAKAAKQFEAMSGQYPLDAGLRQLWFEALIRQGDLVQARRVLGQLASQERRALEAERADLMYALYRNNLRLGGGLAGFSNGTPREASLGAAITQQVSQVTGVLQGGWVERYGQHDTQLGLDLYLPLDPSTRRRLMLGGAISPASSFLPRTACAAEISQGLGEWDFSLGFSRLAFTSDTAHLIIPAATWFLPQGWSLSERLYLVVDTGGFTTLTTVSWEPNHQYKGSVALTLGEAGERAGAAEDLQRYFTAGGRLTGEYRVTMSVSFGGELLFEYRDGLYTKVGGGLFGRYWW